nr:hypothetical protein [Tanacetum cinerariifolium]
MSSASSAVTYTFVYTDSEPGRVFWRTDEELSDGEPMYPEYIPLQDEHVLLAEEQPLPPVDSPTAESLGYVVESNLEEDPEEYKDDESEDGLVDYPIDGRDDGDDDDGDSFRDDTDDEDEDEEDEDEEGDEEEHLALADAAVVVSTVEPVSLPEGTELIIPPPSTDTTTIRARITVRLQASISLPPKTLKIASTQALIDAVIVALPSPPLPPPLYIPPPVDRRDDILETELPPHKKSCLFALGPRYEVRDSFTARPTRGRGIDYGFFSTLDAEARRQGIREVRYGIRDTWVDLAEAVPEIAPMTLREVNTRVTELAEIHEHDTKDLYALLEDAQDSRTRISHRVTMDSQWVDLVMEDMIAHQETILIVEEEAYASREAWAHLIGLSRVVHYELQTHREQVYAHKSHIHEHQTQLQLQSTLIQTQHQALGINGRDSLSDGRHETRDGRIVALVTRRGHNTPPNDTNPNNMTPESVQAMIDQALLRNSTNGDGSHNSDGDNQRNVQIARPCFYADFMKCQPLNFKGTKGVSNTPPDSYSTASHFWGVTDWYQEPSPCEGRSGDVSIGVDGPPVMPEDPYAYVVAAFQALPPPDYVPGPEEPEQAPPSPVYIPYVPEPVYPEYIPPEDDVLPAKEQPLPTAASPTVDSPGYIPESDPDEDSEDDDDEDPEEDPADYLADHDDDEEEEHPALADSIPPPPALRVTARIYFRPQPPTLSFTKEDAKRADRPEVTLPPRKRLSIVH